MRKTFWLLTGMSTVACVATGACSGDDSSSSSADSGNDVQSNGDVVAPSDASGDSGNAPGPATITVKQAGAPFAGAKVVFYKPDGTATTTMTTGADGKATTTVSDGWSVTAAGTVFSGATSYDTITTFVGIEPGDDLAATVPSFASPAVPGTMSISDPGPFAGATQYLHSNGCDQATVASGGATLSVVPSCETAGKVSVIVYALDANGIVLATTQSADITYSDGMTVAGLGLTWAAATSTPISVTGAAPANFTTGFTNAAFIRNAIAYPSPFAGPVFLGDAGVPSLDVELPAGSFVTDDSYNVVLDFPRVGGATPFLGKYAQGPVAGGFSVDFGALPPVVHDPVVTSDGAGNVTLAFTADGSVTALDGMDAAFVWQNPDPADAATTDRFTWLVFAPPNATTVLPKLSTDLASSLPPVGQPQLVSLTLKKGTPFGSYAGFRKSDAMYGVSVTVAPGAYSYVATGIFEL